MAEEDVLTGEETTEDEVSQEEQTSESQTEDETKGETESKDDENKDRRSAIAQKKHWREKAQQASDKVKTLEDELGKLRDAVKKPSDEQEAKAQEYIREQARRVYEELQTQKAKEEERQLSTFESEVESILEENPDVSEEELLDIIEDLEVAPDVALKILKRSTTAKEKKPKMPQAKRASSQTSRGESTDDSKKSMWDITKEEIARLSNK